MPTYAPATRNILFDCFGMHMENITWKMADELREHIAVASDGTREFYEVDGYLEQIKEFATLTFHMARKVQRGY
jgi:hypothetical protein